MKNALLLLCSFAFLASCGSDSNKAPQEQYTLAEPEETLRTDSTTSANMSAVARQPQVDTSITKIGTGPTGGALAKGASLIEGSDCTTCHRVNEKLLGPAYQAVAQKYPATEANIKMLGGKIISGGKGNWGEIAMTPHPAISVADAEEMARYILTLK